MSTFRTMAFGALVAGLALSGAQQAHANDLEPRVQREFEMIQRTETAPAYRRVIVPQSEVRRPPQGDAELNREFWNVQNHERDARYVRPEGQIDASGWSNQIPTPSGP